MQRCINRTSYVNVTVFVTPLHIAASNLALGAARYIFLTPPFVPFWFDVDSDLGETKHFLRITVSNKLCSICLKIKLYESWYIILSLQCPQYKVFNSCLLFRVLLKFGADPEGTDDLGRRPVECIPDIENFDLVIDAQVSAIPQINNLESS